ncbi:STAS domain-containing protein [Bradyrhizobium oligotrophicum]|uniref:STAS domain-containing protein n=1 Tax=Bradyrhizobium oligotrophicum TaxID=44255 RepID=UPI003EC12938
MTDANPTADSGATDDAQVAHVLSSMLDLTQAAHLRDEMVRIAGRGGIVLDASGVERMSTPCVQILLAAARGAQAANKPFKITQASELFLTALAELGLQDEFDNWME